MSIATPRKLRDVLQALYGPCDGVINFRAFGPGYTTSCFYPRSDTLGIAAFLGTHAGERDCFMGVATRRDESSGDAANCLHLNALFADIDFAQSAERDAQMRLASFLYAPSIVIQSGNGLHCYWLMAEPFDLQVAAEAEQAGALLRRLAVYLGADVAAAEIARVLRVPQTYNRKPAYGTPRLVTVEILESSFTYNPSDFDAILPSEPPEGTPVGKKFKVPGVVGPSERNPTLFKLGRSLKATGVAPSAILEALRATNAKHCDPPHPDGEVTRVFDSVMRRRDRKPRVEAVAAAEATGAPALSEAVDAPSEAPDAAPPEVLEASLEVTAALLEDTAAYVRRFVVMSDHQAVTFALWTAHTHTFRAAEATPYLHVTAATKRAGKTLLLEVAEPVVAHPWLTGRTSAAALPRKIDAVAPTLLLDESDQALTIESDYSKALIGVLNSGYRRSGTTSLCIGEGSGLKVVDLKTYCPKAIAGIGKLPDTIADRCIVIKLRRRTRDEPVERARARVIHGAAKPLRQRFPAWAPAATRALLHASPVLPDPLDDRAQDVWEPLLAIAELAGGEWPARARAAAVALSGGRQDDDYATTLLSDIRDVMDAAVVKDERGPAYDVISSTALLKRLTRLKEQPWPTWSKGQPMTAHALAKLLAGFDVASARHWAAGRVVRGYRRDALEALFPRYLGFKASMRQNVNGTGAEPPFSKRQEPEPTDALKNAETSIRTRVLDALTLCPPVDGGSDTATPIYDAIVATGRAIHPIPPSVTFEELRAALRKGGGNGH